MKTPAIFVLTVAAFVTGLVADRILSPARAAPEQISTQIVNIPALTVNDMGGKADAAMRSKNFVTLDGMTLSVQIGSTAKHQHPQGNEIQYIVDGTGKFWLGDKEMDVKPGDLIVIPKGTPHGSSSSVKAIAIKSPVASSDYMLIK